MIETKLPHLVTSLPGPNASRVLDLDRQYVSPSYTRSYPLVARRGRGALVEDVDGNIFLDFAAGIAVVATGHCHPQVVAAIQQQAAELIHMSGTDFYYESLAKLAQKLAAIAPGGASRLLRKFGHGGHRSSHQAGSFSHPSREDRGILRRLPRAHARVALANGVQAGAAARIRRAAFGSVPRAVPESLSLPLRAAGPILLHRVRRIPRTPTVPQSD
jgi:4-aminobutyrate aminotransferase